MTTEPLAKDSALIGRDNVILTPHTAFYSVEALEELQTKCASDVARVLSGEKAIYRIFGLGAASVAQRLALDGAAAHQSRLLARKILARMDRAPIVPDHEIAELPFVLVNDRRIFGDIEQLLQRRLAFIGRKALDARRHQPADIERLLAGRRVRNDDRLLVMQNFFQRHLQRSIRSRRL